MARDLVVSKRVLDRLQRGEAFKSAALVGVMRGDTLKVRVSTDAREYVATVTAVEYERDRNGFSLVGSYRLGFDSDAHV